MGTTLTKLGGGVFTATDAAKILRVSPSKIHYWFRYYLEHNHFKVKSELYYFKAGNTKAVNFYTLIEICVFYALRSRGITVPKIIEAHEILSKKLGTLYPFAHEPVYAAGRNVLTKYNDIFVSADRKKQTKLNLELDKFFQKIEYTQDGVAQYLHPISKKNSVIVHPEHQFGNPTIKGTNIRTAVIYNLYKAGESKTSIAKLYDITRKQIDDVIAFSEAA